MIGRSGEVILTQDIYQLTVTAENKELACDERLELRVSDVTVK